MAKHLLGKPFDEMSQFRWRFRTRPLRVSTGYNRQLFVGVRRSSPDPLPGQAAVTATGARATIHRGRPRENGHATPARRLPLGRRAPVPTPVRRGTRRVVARRAPEDIRARTGAAWQEARGRRRLDSAAPPRADRMAATGRTIAHGPPGTGSAASRSGLSAGRRHWPERRWPSRSSRSWSPGTRSRLRSRSRVPGPTASSHPRAP